MFQTILLTSVGTGRSVLYSRLRGICPFLGVSKKTSSAFSMGIAVTLVMVIATLVTFPLYMYVLKPLNIAYLEIIFFIFIIAALVQMLEKILA